MQRRLGNCLVHRCRYSWVKLYFLNTTQAGQLFSLSMQILCSKTILSQCIPGWVLCMCPSVVMLCYTMYVSQSSYVMLCYVCRLEQLCYVCYVMHVAKNSYVILYYVCSLEQQFYVLYVAYSYYVMFVMFCYVMYVTQSSCYVVFLCYVMLYYAMYVVYSSCVILCYGMLSQSSYQWHCIALSVETGLICTICHCTLT